MKALGGLVGVRAVGPRTWVVLEHSARTAPPPRLLARPPLGPSMPDREAGLSRFDTRRYGDTALTFYKPDILDPRSP